MKRIIYVLCFIFTISMAQSASDLDLEYSYDQQIFGVDRQNSIITRSYSIGLSTYLFDLTALDINFSRSVDINTSNDVYKLTGYNLTCQSSRVQTDDYGIGIKQMLANRGSFIIPMIAVGYSKEIINSDSSVTVLNTSNSVSTVYNTVNATQNYNSMYGIFSLQLKLFQGFALKGSIKTTIQDFKFNKAKDNLKYMAGVTISL